MQSWCQPQAHPAPPVSLTEGCWHDRGMRYAREAARLSGRRVKSAFSRFASPARFAKDVYSFVDVSVRLQRDEVTHHRLGHWYASRRRAKRLNALLARRPRPGASFARSLLSDRLAQATTSRPHSTSSGIDRSAASRQITRHNALVGIPHVASTRGYDARIYRMFGACRTGI